MHFTEPTIHKATQEHQCSWCGEIISCDQHYNRYRWFEDGEASTIKIHPECLAAMDELNDPDMRFAPGNNPRGCNCGFDRDCERCNSEETG